MSILSNWSLWAHAKVQQEFKKNGKYNNNLWFSAFHKDLAGMEWTTNVGDLGIPSKTFVQIAVSFLVSLKSKLCCLHLRVQSQSCGLGKNVFSACHTKSCNISLITGSIECIAYYWSDTLSTKCSSCTVTLESDELMFLIFLSFHVLCESQDNWARQSSWGRHNL